MSVMPTIHALCRHVSPKIYRKQCKTDTNFPRVVTCSIFSGAYETLSAGSGVKTFARFCVERKLQTLAVVGCLERTRHRSFVDSSSFFVEWHSSILLGQVGVAVGDTVVAVAVAVGIAATTAGQTFGWLLPVLSVVMLRLILLVALIALIAGVLPMSTTIRLTVLSVRISCLVICSLACVTLRRVGVRAFSGSPWRDVQVAELKVLLEHGIAPLSAVLTLLVVAFHFFRLSWMRPFSAISTALSLLGSFAVCPSSTWMSWLSPVTACYSTRTWYEGQMYQSYSSCPSKDVSHSDQSLVQQTASYPQFSSAWAVSWLAGLVLS